MARLLLPWLAAVSSSDLDTEVLIIGGGLAGLGAIERLRQANITDFLLLEATDHIGGRVQPKSFGSPKVHQGIVEQGANWIHGTGERNPNWRLAERIGLATRPLPGSCANISLLGLFWANGTEAVDAAERQMAGNRAYDCINATSQRTQRSGEDESAAAALDACGFPAKDALDDTIRWELTSANDEIVPERLSLWYTIPDPTYQSLSPDDHFVHDQRPLGYSAIAHEVLKDAGVALDDARLMFNSVVERIDTSRCDAVRVRMADGRELRSRYVISTLPLGVMRADGASLFEPALPAAQTKALQKGLVGNFTKMFIQFPEVFWSSKPVQWLAAPERPDDPKEFHDFDAQVPGFGTLFTYVTDPYSVEWEALSDGEAQAKLLDRLRRLFPEVQVPEPTAFFMTRHGLDPFTRGAYSTNAVGWSDEDFEAMVAPLTSCERPRVVFGGEHACEDYSGFVHGAYWSGKDAANDVLSNMGVVPRPSSRFCEYDNTEQFVV